MSYRTQAIVSSREAASLLPEEEVTPLPGHLRPEDILGASIVEDGADHPLFRHTGTVSFAVDT